VEATNKTNVSPEKFDLRWSVDKANNQLYVNFVVKNHEFKYDEIVWSLYSSGSGFNVYEQRRQQPEFCMTDNSTNIGTTGSVTDVNFGYKGLASSIDGHFSNGYAGYNDTNISKADTVNSVYNGKKQRIYLDFESIFYEITQGASGSFDFAYTNDNGDVCDANGNVIMNVNTQGYLRQRTEGGNTITYGDLVYVNGNTRLYIPKADVTAQLNILKRRIDITIDEHIWNKNGGEVGVVGESLIPNTKIHLTNATQANANDITQGQDVVNGKSSAILNKLGGDVSVSTELGKGTTFTVRLPLTLAIIQALMVEIRDEIYAIALGSISNIEDIPVKDIKYVQAKEVIHLRGSVIPIIRLDKMLDIEPKEQEPDHLTVVIVQKGDQQAGLVVDNLIGQQEIVIKSLGKYINGNKLISGATILGDGDVALILDVNTLM